MFSLLCAGMPQGRYVSRSHLGKCVRRANLIVNDSMTLWCRFDGKRLMIFTETSTKALPERIVTCRAAAQVAEVHMRHAHAGAQQFIPQQAAIPPMQVQQQQQPRPDSASYQASRGGGAAHCTNHTRGKVSIEEEWLSQILGLMRKKAPGELFELGLLGNKTMGGIPRPDGVNLKMRDLLEKHAQRCNLVLSKVGSTSYVSLAPTDGRSVEVHNSQGPACAPRVADTKGKGVEQPMGGMDEGEANTCNICFEQQCDTRMVPCLHKICHGNRPCTTLATMFPLLYI